MFVAFGAAGAGFQEVCSFTSPAWQISVERRHHSPTESMGRFERKHSSKHRLQAPETIVVVCFFPVFFGTSFFPHRRLARLDFDPCRRRVRESLPSDGRSGDHTEVPGGPKLEEKGDPYRH